MIKTSSFIAVIVIILVANSQIVKFNAINTLDSSKQQDSYSHSTYFFKNQPRSQLKRHNLKLHMNEYQAAPLITNHYSFLLPMTIQGIQYKLSIDTGSSDIFIKGQESPGAPKDRYKSNEDYKNKPIVYIGYLDGRLTTYNTTLTVQFLGYKIQTPLLVAYQNDKKFDRKEGLIGLSYPSIAQNKPTFIQTLIKNDIIQKYAYGVNLNLIQQNRSFISFGSPDPQFYQGQLRQYDILNRYGLQLKFEYLKFGDGQKMKVRNALMDTGNTCISIPNKYQQDILNSFNIGNNRCKFFVQESVPMFSILRCVIQNLDQVPNLKISFDDQTVHEIQKSYFLKNCARKQNDIKYYCQTYIQSFNPSSWIQDIIILGDTFFNRFYTYFDLQEHKIGIAKNRQNVTMQVILNQQVEYNQQLFAQFDQ